MRRVTFRDGTGHVDLPAKGTEFLEDGRVELTLLDEHESHEELRPPYVVMQGKFLCTTPDGDAVVSCGGLLVRTNRPEVKHSIKTVRLVLSNNDQSRNAGGTMRSTKSGGRSASRARHVLQAARS